MKSSSQLGRKKAAVGIGAVLLLVASLITVSAAVSAQTGACGADTGIAFDGPFFGTGDYGNHLLSVANADGPTSIGPVSLALPAGTYALNAVARDGYEGRESVNQPSEQWLADFHAADGSYLATSRWTGDVPDNREAGEWAGSIGEITLSSDAATVTFRHAAPGPGNTPNSVRVVCLGATLISSPSPCEGAAADGSDGATDADGNACVDPCDGAVVGDGATDADGKLCNDPCEAALVAVGVSAEAAAEACGADTPEECVAMAVANENNAADAAPEACGVETGTEGTGDACVDALVAEGATVDGATTACGSDTAEACVAAAVDAGADQAAAEAACDGITTEVEGATVTNDGGDTGDNGAGDDDDDNGAGDTDTEVLGATITAPVAQAQTGNPTFTG